MRFVALFIAGVLCASPAILAAPLPESAPGASSSTEAGLQLSPASGENTLDIVPRGFGFGFHPLGNGRFTNPKWSGSLKPPLRQFFGGD